MFSSISHIIGAISLLAFLPITAVSADAPNELYSGPKAQSKIEPAPSGKIVTIIDGKVQPIYFAALAEPSLEYKRAGFNTFHYELSFDNSKELEEHFESWDNGLLKVKQAGLYVMIYIHNTIHANAGNQPWSFDDQWRDTVHKIVARYKDITNLIA